VEAEQHDRTSRGVTAPAAPRRLPAAVFYRARAWVEQAGLGIPCGFIHLPPREALPLERQLEAVTTCLSLLTPDRP
jgi:pyrrolidone-carboxylate peptidase